MATPASGPRRALAAIVAVACAAVWVLASPAHAGAATTVNDPMFPQQWGTRLVRAPEAWGSAPTRWSPTIAVIDTGVEATTADLSGALLPAKVFIQDGKSGDPNGHGTATAGLLAARGNNGLGVAGYCWACRILPLRVLDENAGGSAATVAEAVRWATDHGASVINLSLVMLGTYAPLDDAIAYAHLHDVVVVAAAGNGGGTKATYPAASPHVIGVVGTDRNDAPYTWADRGTWADVAAPGCAMTTQVGGAFAESCGSSMAAPAVAGVIGLVRSIYRSATVADIEAAIDASSKPLPGVVRAGRIDAVKLLASVRSRLQAKVASERIAGVSRIETAVDLSRQVRSSATDVVIATGDAYADALSASSLAGHVDGPVLLTSGARLPAVVADEIRRLGATTAWIVGGEAPVPSATESDLRAAGIVSVRRLAGVTRYHTAAAVARAIGSDRVIVTEAHSWADATAASPLAALEKRPILLVDRTSVPIVTRDVLRDLAVRDVLAVGAPSSLDDTVLAALRATGADVQRVTAGSTSTTSTRIADLSGAATDTSVAWLATSANWPDALAAGPASVASGSLLVLVDGSDSAGMNTTLDWFSSHADVPDQFVVVGGEASLPSSTMTWFESTLLAP